MNTNTNRNKRAIGTFPTRKVAEQTLQELKDSGFDMNQVSVVAKDLEQNENMTAKGDVSDHPENNEDDTLAVSALSGGALGTIGGLLVGLGALAIPGVGPIVLAGAISTAVATTLTGGAIGAAAGGLVGGTLVGLGIPEEQAKVYNDRLSAGEYLVIVDGTDAEIADAKSILNHYDVQEWGVYDLPATESTTENQYANVDPSIDMDEQVTPNSVNNPDMSQSTPSDDTQTMKLYEERLVMDKDRKKIGEVTVGKHVEVETANVSVPLEKEQVVIVTIPPSGETTTNDNVDAFDDNEGVRVEVYEDTPAIRKETFVREEVNIRKEVNQETVKGEQTLRREELDVDTQGNSLMDNSSNQTENPRR